MATTKTTARQALAYFATLLGTGETPPGSNTNFITRWFGYSGAWCAMTISYVLNKFSCLWMIHGKQDYTVTLYQNAVKDHTWRSSEAKPKPGWLVLFNFGDWNWGGRPLGIHHVGMVKQHLSDGRIATYEGNTADAVRLRFRSRDNIAGYVALPWAPESALPDGVLFVAWVPNSKAHGWEAKALTEKVAHVAIGTTHAVYNRVVADARRK